MSDTPHLHIQFYTDTRENPAESREQGRPIFEEVEMVKIQMVGDPKNTLIAPAHTASKRNPETGQPWTYAEQYPEHYRFFKDNADQQGAAGTPLSEAPWLSASKREELKALKIFTIDGLASLDGSALGRLGMGGRELKNKAQAWLDAAAGHSGESRLAEELAQRDREIEAMKEQLAMLTAGKVTAAPVEPEPIANTDEGVWSTYADDDLKNFINDRTGRKPSGQPKRETLIRMANEIIEAETQAA